MAEIVRPIDTERINPRFPRRSFLLIPVSLGVAAIATGCGEEKIRITDDDPDVYLKGKVSLNLGDRMQFAHRAVFEGDFSIDWKKVQAIYGQPVDTANPFSIENPLIRLKTTTSNVFVHMLQLPLTVPMPSGYPEGETETNIVYINLNPTENKYKAPKVNGFGYFPVIREGDSYYEEDASGNPVGGPIVPRIIQNLPSVPSTPRG